MFINAVLFLVLRKFWILLLAVCMVGKNFSLLGLGFIAIYTIGILGYLFLMISKRVMNRFVTVSAVMVSEEATSFSRNK